jgi:4'-phosphopantetheinyl transferase EntD
MCQSVITQHPSYSPMHTSHALSQDSAKVCPPQHRTQACRHRRNRRAAHLEALHTCSRNALGRSRRGCDPAAAADSRAPTHVHRAQFILVAFVWRVHAWMRRQSFGKMVGARPSDLAIPPPQHAGATMMGIYRTHTPSCTGREPALPPLHPPSAVSLLLPRRPPSPPSAGMSVWPSASRRDTTRPPTRTASAAGSRRLVSWSSACHRRRRRPRSFLAGRLAAAAVARPPSRRSRPPPPPPRAPQPQPASIGPAGSLSHYEISSAAAAPRHHASLWPGQGGG